MEAFLGRVHDPQPTAGHSPALSDPAHRAILFTDIVGSTGITQRLGDLMTTELIRAHDSVVRRCLKRFGGQEVKHTGDGIMASFPQSKAAVDAAILIQQDSAVTTPTIRSRFMFALDWIVENRSRTAMTFLVIRSNSPLVCVQARTAVGS